VLGAYQFVVIQEMNAEGSDEESCFSLHPANISDGFSLCCGIGTAQEIDNALDAP
jgi:hypothetical protein